MYTILLSINVRKHLGSEKNRCSQTLKRFKSIRWSVYVGFRNTLCTTREVRTLDDCGGGVATRRPATTPPSYKKARCTMLTSRRCRRRVSAHNVFAGGPCACAFAASPEGPRQESCVKERERTAGTNEPSPGKPVVVGTVHTFRSVPTRRRRI